MGRKRYGKKNKNAGDTLDATTDPSIPVLVDSLHSDLFSCEVSHVFGRYLKAKVDITKGTVVIQEKPLVVGPKTTTSACCVGCHADLLKTSNTSKCSKCDWPICSKGCEESPYHTTECEFFAEHKIKPPADFFDRIFGVVTVIRALLLKIHDTRNWKRFILLQHHNEERVKLSIWKENAKLVQLIREHWGLHELFTEDEIFQTCGILEVNSFELGDVHSFGGIFPLASMIAHECVPNASYFDNADTGCLEVVAVVDIPSGSPLTLCYDAVLKGTTERHRRLARDKYFICTCKRCNDPLELGTNLSTLICQKCKKGSVTKSPTEPSTWICNRCGNKIEHEDVVSLESRYSVLADGLNDIKGKEAFLTEVKGELGPTHWISLGIKFSLCMAYGRDEGYTLYELSQSEAHRKLQLCQDVLKVLDVLIPGYSVIRGNILYELQAAEVLISRNLLETGKVSKALIKRRLQNTLKVLNEAIFIFELSYPTRLLGRDAKATTLVELKSWMNSLK